VFKIYLQITDIKMSKLCTIRENAYVKHLYLKLKYSFVHM